MAFNWETFPPGLALSCSTSYNLMIGTTPFELLFVEKACLPSFPNKDNQNIHFGETSVAECFNLLQKIRRVAHENEVYNGQNTKEQFNK
jgi:hypothetical protein